MGKDSAFTSQIASGLANLRKSKGLTQGELAKALKTTQAVISRMESGRALPSWTFIERVLRVLGAEAEVTFELLEKPQTAISGPAVKTQEYICVNCMHRWQSDLDRSVIQCPGCHKRQGVLFSEYSEALKAFQELQSDVRKSPPFKKFPPVNRIKSNAPILMRLVLESAGKTFPSPRLPVSLLYRILQESRAKSES